MQVKLHAAQLSYGGGLVLHTAASGSIAQLSELYLSLDDGQVPGVGEIRANIAYLNGLSRQEVIEDAIAAIGSIDWRCTPEELLAATGCGLSHHTAAVRALVDCALHDLVARRRDIAVHQLLGGMGVGPIGMSTNQTLFLSPLDDFMCRARTYVARGFCDLKVRIGACDPAKDLRRVAALRDAFGDGVRIAADANGAWSATEATTHLRTLSEFRLAYVEQPLPAGDWDAIARLAEASPTLIMLDESVASERDIDRICALRDRCGGRLAAHLKLVKLGGIAPTFAAARRLATAGVPFMIGQMNEGGAATAAALHVAAATAPAFAELYGADGILDDPAQGLVYAEGQVRCDHPAGLGIAFDPAKTETIREFPT